jgi:hypothetical protein
VCADKALARSLLAPSGVRSIVLAAMPLLLAGCPGRLQDAERFGAECRQALDVPSEVLGARCGDSDCHDAVEPEGSLDLVSPGLELRLRNVPASRCTGRLRVDPAFPEDSFLLEKLGRDDPECGDRMPLLAGPLSAPTLACVRDWIKTLSENEGGAESTTTTLEHRELGEAEP